MKRLHALLIALLLIALPLQGIAAFTPVAACTGHPAAKNGSPAQHHAPAVATHHDAALPDHHQGDADPAKTTGGHTCCHHVVSAVPPLLITSPPEAPQIFVARISLLDTLFIPERPQRPPRA